MGWCSGTEIFDTVCEALFNENLKTEDILERVINILENLDWDCQGDSLYFRHPAVKRAFIKTDPDWQEYYDEIED